MSNLWVTASEDTEQQNHRQLFASLRIEAVQYWSFLSDSETPADFNNRLAMIAPQLDQIVRGRTDAGSFLTARAELEDTLIQDFAIVLASRSKTAVSSDCPAGCPVDLSDKGDRDYHMEWHKSEEDRDPGYKAHPEQRKGHQYWDNQKKASVAKTADGACSYCADNVKMGDQCPQCGYTKVATRTAGTEYEYEYASDADPTHPDYKMGYEDARAGEFIDGLHNNWDGSKNGNDQYGYGFNAGCDWQEVDTGYRREDQVSANTPRPVTAGTEGLWDSSIDERTQCPQCHKKSFGGGECHSCGYTGAKAASKIAIDADPAIPGGTVVQTFNQGDGEVVLTPLGFYGRCTVPNCTWVGETQYGRPQAAWDVRAHLGLPSDTPSDGSPADLDFLEDYNYHTPLALLTASKTADLIPTEVQCARCLAEIPAVIDDQNLVYTDSGCPNGCDEALVDKAYNVIPPENIATPGASPIPDFTGSKKTFRYANKVSDVFGDVLDELGDETKDDKKNKKHKAIYVPCESCRKPALASKTASVSFCEDCQR